MQKNLRQVAGVLTKLCMCGDYDGRRHTSGARVLCSVDQGYIYHHVPQVEQVVVHPRCRQTEPASVIIHTVKFFSQSHVHCKLRYAVLHRFAAGPSHDGEKRLVILHAKPQGVITSRRRVLQPMSTQAFSCAPRPGPKPKALFVLCASEKEAMKQVTQQDYIQNLEKTHALMEQYINSLELRYAQAQAEMAMVKKMAIELLQKDGESLGENTWCVFRFADGGWKNDMLPVVIAKDGVVCFPYMDHRVVLRPKNGGALTSASMADVVRDARQPLIHIMTSGGRNTFVKISVKHGKEQSVLDGQEHDAFYVVMNNKTEGDYPHCYTRDELEIIAGPEVIASWEQTAVCKDDIWAAPGQRHVLPRAKKNEYIT